ncbi:radical SAM protein [Lacrimispora celerecrescens]|uniref:4Fe-4S single cluster protein n=1 Tax=[Clostridium] celerecrescens 18A TaxID=1286362 RepID=A0A2M8ZCI4_9FIRM|nr:radical SAM protein [Lacrimispora celerecrescens]PJJ31135.1 4Fe-4S single cluster protein [[Clostridium] celerecrescens 18A]
MKWINKGHEFDSIYERICEKEKYLLFGAGDLGIKSYHILKEEINIVGFIDNDEKKRCSLEYDKPVISLAEVKWDEKLGIIITPGQMQRRSIYKELLSKGYHKNIDFFDLEEFLGIYFVYKYNKVYFYNISFLPSTVCNLKCEACLNFNALAKHYYTREWNNLIKDVDMFFSCVDNILLFHVSGGEPLLYPRIADLIDYIDKKYGNRIYQLRTVTNGTVIPSDHILEKLSKCNVDITVDDYREAVPQYNDNFDVLIQKLEKYGISYHTSKVDSWIDLAPLTTDYSNWTDVQLREHFDNCCHSWQELRDGKLFSCNYDSYATVAGINEEQDVEVFDLKTYTTEQSKALIEFRLGYNEKGYTNLCKHCRGFLTDDNISVPPARQVIGTVLNKL